MAATKDASGTTWVVHQIFGSKGIETVQKTCCNPSLRSGQKNMRNLGGENLTSGHGDDCSSQTTALNRS